MAANERRGSARMPIMPSLAMRENSSAVATPTAIGRVTKATVGVTPISAGRTRPPRTAAGGSWYSRYDRTTGTDKASCTTSTLKPTRLNR